MVTWIFLVAVFIAGVLVNVQEVKGDYGNILNRSRGISTTNEITGSVLIDEYNNKD